VGLRSQDFIFHHFGVQHFGNPEDKVSEHFGIGNPEVLKELGFQYFSNSEIEGSRRQRLSTTGLMESQNLKFLFWEKVTDVLEAVSR
jgi:hypothetical protein